MMDIKKDMFLYNANKKKINGLLTIAISVVFILGLIYYFFYLRNSDNVFFKTINNIIGTIYNEIDKGTKIGVLYSALFGGLFFVVIPTELVFLNFLIKETLNSWILLIVYIAGIFVAYNINYYTGYKLKGVSKFIITPKKFYKIKGKLNKYGGLVIYLMNAIPFMPAQPLSTILGVFNYNRMRFYFYSFFGLLTKYVAMILIYKYLNIDLVNIFG